MQVFLLGLLAYIANAAEVRQAILYIKLLYLGKYINPFLWKFARPGLILRLDGIIHLLFFMLQRHNPDMMFS